MKCSFSDTPYQWQDGEAWHVGRLVMACSGVAVITEGDGTLCDDAVGERDAVLVRHLHTNALEFVEWGKLSPYPSEAIPEPTNTGKVEGE